jgi:hypothetical protein
MFQNARRSIFISLFISIFLYSNPSLAENAVSDLSAAASIPAVPKKIRTPDEQKKIQEVRERMKQMREKLNGSRWEVAVKSASDSKIKPFNDILTFQDDLILSAFYDKRGFSSTNYSISVSPDPEVESAVWETMKTGKEGTVFLRGEWEKDAMQGSVTEQLDGGKKVVEYYFTSKLRKEIPKSSKKPESEEKTAESDSPILQNDTPASSGSSLVSKERVTESVDSVSAFIPGTIEEAAKS